MSEFNLGDVVKLAGTGLRMTIRRIKIDENEERTYECDWFSSDDLLQTNLFKASSLEPDVKPLIN